VVSILDRGNATVVVHPQVETTDSDGNPVWGPSEDGIELDVMLWPLTLVETASLGREFGEVYRVRPVRGQEIPVGPWATVEWDGRTWDVHGETVRHQRGKATRRTTFVIRARTKRPGDGSDDG
jgi:hypothetical protein